MMYAAGGDDWLSSGRLKVRFKAPARPADTVTASATAAGERAWSVQCANGRGEVLIEGRANIGGPS
jgi:acyl dehydratase